LGCAWLSASSPQMLCIQLSKESQGTVFYHEELLEWLKGPKVTGPPTTTSQWRSAEQQPSCSLSATYESSAEALRTMQMQLYYVRWKCSNTTYDASAVVTIWALRWLVTPVECTCSTCWGMAVLPILVESQSVTLVVSALRTMQVHKHYVRCKCRIFTCS
jgi:hypothetical protein